MPSYLIKHVHCIDVSAGLNGIHDVLIGQDGIVLDPIGSHGQTISCLDGKGLVLCPGFVDLHVHFREPGFEHKETIASGCRAALKGGFTTVMVMPNTHPVIDDPMQVREQLAIGKRNGQGVRLLVSGAMTKGLQGEEMTNIPALVDAGVSALTDDGRPVMQREQMRCILEIAKTQDALVMQHAEDFAFSRHASLHEGKVSKSLGILGQSAQAEWGMIERDLELVQATNARYHALHISTARSLKAISDAKAKGLLVSCEVTPHHLLLNEEAVRDLDPNKKMNPPLREESDRLALIQGIWDQTVDAVATDHAPHSLAEKQRGFEKAPFGVVGLETAFAALMQLVHGGWIQLEQAIALLTKGPATVLRQTGQIGTFVGRCAMPSAVLLDPNKEWIVCKEEMAGLSWNSAFLGMRFRGKVLATFLNGNMVYRDRIIE